MKRMILCLDCGEWRPHAGRGICDRDYRLRTIAGTLVERPPISQRVSIPELLKDTGVTYQQIDYWIRAGYLRPERAGKGRFRQWPAAERKIIRVMARLIAAGMTVQTAHKVARYGPNLAPGVRVIVDLRAMS